MRLVDADNFEVFVIRTNGDEEFVNGVQYVLEKIDKAPTVDAVPISVLEDIKSEIQNCIDTCEDFLSGRYIMLEPEDSYKLRVLTYKQCLGFINSHIRRGRTSLI